MKYQLFLAGVAALALAVPAYAQDNSVAARGSPNEMSSTKTGGQSGNQSKAKKPVKKSPSAKRTGANVTRPDANPAANPSGPSSHPTAPTNGRNVGNGGNLTDGGRR